MTTIPQDILIGVITCQRPVLLAGTLASLAAQQCDGLPVRLVVVDNDAGGSARPVYERFKAAFPFPSGYLVEPTRGISHARNRVLEHALATGAAYIAFIDDDMTAAADWIAELHGAIAASGADGVQGAVEYRLPEAAPAWARREYARKNAKARRRSGQVNAMDTNNVIFSSALLGNGTQWFDNRFALTGGEDAEFFRRAKQGGARYLAINTARATEVVPASRLTMRWHCMRYFRNGTNSMRIARLHRRRADTLALLAKAARRMLVGVAMLPLGLANRTLLFRSLRRIASALGLFSGLFSMSYAEYRHIHGQ